MERMVQNEKVRKAFAARLHRALDDLGIKAHGRGVWLSKKAGVSSKAAGKWLNGESLPESWRMPGLAAALKTTASKLQYDEDHTLQLHAPGESEAEWGGELDLWDGETPINPDEVVLPLFREVEVSAGSGRTQVIENHGAKLRFAKNSLQKAGVDPANAGCAFVKGNSMEPVLPDGSAVGVDTGSTHIRDGKMYAIDHDGLLRVKQVYRLPGGGIRLRSFNRDEHPDEEYSAEEAADNIRVIGKVFWGSWLDY